MMLATTPSAEMLADEDFLTFRRSELGGFYQLTLGHTWLKKTLGFVPVEGSKALIKHCV